MIDKRADELGQFILNGYAETCQNIVKTLKETVKEITDELETVDTLTPDDCRTTLMAEIIKFKEAIEAEQKELYDPIVQAAVDYVTLCRQLRQEYNDDPDCVPSSLRSKKEILRRTEGSARKRIHEAVDNYLKKKKELKKDD